MLSKSLTSLAFAAGCILAFGATPSANAQALGPTDVITNGPQASAGDFGEWSPRLNNIESRRYDRLLETNMAFRAHRMRLECGPITLPALRERCLQSFAQYEPAGRVTEGFGGGTAPVYTPGAGSGSTLQGTSTNRMWYPPTPAPSGADMTPGASGVPQTYGYR